MKYFFTHNIGLKLISLSLGFLVWFVVREITNETFSLSEIPLEVKTSEGWVLESVSVNQIEVSFLGSREDLLKLDKERIRVFLDLSGRELEEEHAVSLNPKNVLFDGAARVVSINPPELQVKLDRIGRKKVPVKLSASQQAVLKGYAIEIIPSEVTVFGSAQKIKTLEYISPQELAVQGKEFELHVNLDLSTKPWIDKAIPTQVLLKGVSKNGQKME